MKIEMKGDITVNASASKVWKILARDFGDIGQWASIIINSKAITDNEGSGDGKLTGRVCSAQGFGDTVEELTHFDEDAMRFTYKAIKGLPFFIKSAKNNWSVHSLSENETMVKSCAEIAMPFFPGIILAPIFKFMMGGKGKEMFEELKFYVEQGQPHPRKEKQLQASNKV